MNGDPVHARRLRNSGGGEYLGTGDAIAAARAELAGGVYQHIIVFFSIEHDPQVLLDALKRNFADTPVSGCSTSGEVGPLGMIQGGIVLIAFLSPVFGS